ncbi:hypothetical protein AB0N06_25850 [Streptomyces sp. NPDC051020]
MWTRAHIRDLPDGTPRRTDRPAVDAAARIGRPYAHHATVML